MGDPAPIVSATRAAGVPLIAMVSTAEEARLSVAAGADAVIAQGAEAGGHRATFEPGDEPPLVGTLALVPRVVDAVDCPVVAAGGIMDGRGLAAALALGAQGVSLGTRFMLATEAGVADCPPAPAARARGGRHRRLRRRHRPAGALGAQPDHGRAALRPALAGLGRAGPRDRRPPRRRRAVAPTASCCRCSRGRAPASSATVRPAGEIVAEIARDAERILRALAPPAGW